MEIFPLMDSLWNLIVYIGIFGAALFVAGCVYYTLKNFFVFFLAEPLGFTVDFKELGEWAVVTGATDGIGKGYALDLARRGCNIILISRTESKLNNVAKEIEATYGVRTKVVVADFTAGEEIYKHIKASLHGLEIGVLVNNVGMLHDYPDYFDQVPGEEDIYIKMIRCNIMSQTVMTRIVIPQMIERKKGVIVNLSSGAGTNPVPLVAVYSASKAYNHFFSKALEIEYRDRGIIVQSIKPFVVSTNMALNVESNIFVVDAKKFARSCLNTVGYFDVSNGHPSHALQNWFVVRVPLLIADRLAFFAMKFASDEAKRRSLAKKK